MATNKRRALPLPLRKAVWDTYIGTSINGVCFVCETAPISFGTTVEYGHVLAFANEGADTVENLRPICSACNKSMGTRNLLDYKADLARAKTDNTIAACASTSVIGAAFRQVARDMTENESRILANLQILTDEQIATLSAILGCANNREAIARHEYTLPRVAQFHRVRRPRRDDARKLIAELSAEQLADIFGSSGENIDSSRRHAMKMIGML